LLWAYYGPYVAVLRACVLNRGGDRERLVTLDRCSCAIGMQLTYHFGDVNARCQPALNYFLGKERLDIRKNSTLQLANSQIVAVVSDSVDRMFGRSTVTTILPECRHYSVIHV